ncbi:hypothetical protein BJ741DRAFT_646967 [Chytriomyces cf. hyalinus JEL632]|nr:hypothetical protein BJ741DRAFT_646967 [Chytriomyces cf. hyalinus JEL632]
MATNRFAIVIAATIISLLGIFLALSFSSNTAESNRLITEHFLNSPTLPPLSTADGTWQKFRIRTGNGDETLAPRTSADLVKLAANKRVMLMGDSMTNQVFEALYSDMDYLGIKVVEKDLHHKCHVDENQNGFEVWWRRFYVPMFNTTIQTTKTYKYHYHKEEFALTPSTANLSLTRTENITDPFKMDDLMVTRREHVQWMIDQSDIILFQMGYHYQPELSLNGKRRNDNAAKLFEPTMHMLFAWFHDIRNQTGKRFIVRDILPTNNRDLVHEKLCNQQTFRYDQENALLQKLAQQYDLPFVQTEQFYLDKGHAKVGVRKESKKIDCLHYCMNQFIYAPVINALYEAMYTDLFTQSLLGNVSLFGNVTSETHKSRSFPH